MKTIQNIITFAIVIGFICSGLSIASYNGQLVSAQYPKTVQAGVDDLDIVVTVRNTGTDIWLGSFGNPGWICELAWEKGESTVSSTRYVYETVVSGANSTATITLSETEIPDVPGTYSYIQLYAYYPESSYSTEYYAMSKSPITIKFTVTADSPPPASDFDDEKTKVLSDDFNDNSMSTLWAIGRVFDDCGESDFTLNETKSCLEFSASLPWPVDDPWYNDNCGMAFYYSNQWWLDVNQDFSFKINYQHPQTTGDAELFMGIAPSTVSIEDIDLYIGLSADYYDGEKEYIYWHEGEENYDYDWVERTTNNGTLYISYDTSADALYLSYTGYGQANAWKTVSGVLKGQWGGIPIYLGFGGAAYDGTIVNAGQLYLDNFVLDEGVVTPPIPSSMSIQKCTVTAGKTQAQSSISFSGILDATQDDLLGANNIVVSINANDLPQPLDFTFPINTTTLKKGKFSSKSSNISFALDTKTGKITFSAKNVDLTGLACPITITVTIRDYSAQAELDEAIVNGAKKPCPIQLLMGVKNTLTVNKVILKHGKIANTDSLAISGTFTIAGSYSKSDPLAITLGGQTFTVPGGQFIGKNRIESCKTASNEGPLVTAKLDFVKCAYTISVKNAEISQNGTVDFGINCFGGNLEGLATVDLN